MTEETKDLVARLRQGRLIRKEPDVVFEGVIYSGGEIREVPHPDAIAAADLIDHLVLTSNEVKADKVGSGAALDDDMPTIWEDPAGKGYPCFERPMTGAECAALIDKQADEIERLKATPPQVPDGYVIVPKVPTTDMIRAAAVADADTTNEQHIYSACWTAMIAAAPEQPASAAGWRDISTAPKDRTRVLACWKPLRPSAKIEWAVVYWLSGANGWREGGNDVALPDYWQPLPPAPDASVTEREG